LMMLATKENIDMIVSDWNGTVRDKDIV
jgi:hypothetical protein